VAPSKEDRDGGGLACVTEGSRLEITCLSRGNATPSVADISPGGGATHHQAKRRNSKKTPRPAIHGSFCTGQERKEPPNSRQFRGCRRGMNAARRAISSKDAPWRR